MKIGVQDVTALEGGDVRGNPARLPIFSFTPSPSPRAVSFCREGPSAAWYKHAGCRVPPVAGMALRTSPRVFFSGRHASHFAGSRSCWFPPFPARDQSLAPGQLSGAGVSFPMSRFGMSNRSNAAQRVAIRGTHAGRQVNVHSEPCTGWIFSFSRPMKDQLLSHWRADLFPSP